MEDFILSPSYEMNLSDLWKQVDGVSDDFTLLDLVRIVRTAESAHPGLASAFGMPNIDAFYEESIRERDQDDDSVVTHLELYWTFDYGVERVLKASRWNKSRPKGKKRIPNVRETPGRGDMQNLMCFHGIGRHWDDPHIGCDQATCEHHNAYGISFTPLNNLAHLPIRLDICCRIYKPWRIRHSGRAERWLSRIAAPITRWLDKKADCPIMTIDIRPTLHAFISSVFWELTFSGSHPDDRDANSEEMKKLCEDAKLELERGELRSFDELLDEMDEDDT